MIQTRISGIENFDKLLAKYPVNAKRAASMTINSALTKTRTWSQREILGQVNFKATYLNENLTVSRRATQNDLIGTVAGRRRPTTLTRFVTNQGAKKSSPKVKVGRNGSAKTLKRAFIVEGRSGNKLLILRTKGIAPEASYKPRRYGPSGNLWVAYGPSVDQVFKTVKVDIAPRVTDFLNSEFLRNFNRINR
jgi:hypothetical protein